MMSAVRLCRPLRGVIGFKAEIPENLCDADCDMTTLLAPPAIVQRNREDSVNKQAKRAPLCQLLTTNRQVSPAGLPQFWAHQRPYCAVIVPLARLWAPTLNPTRAPDASSGTGSLSMSKAVSVIM